MAHVAAVGSYLRSAGTLPVNASVSSIDWGCLERGGSWLSEVGFALRQLRNRGGRPLRYAVLADVPNGETGFDVAFSHEVIYLLRDLAAHTASVYGVLRRPAVGTSPPSACTGHTQADAGTLDLATWVRYEHEDKMLFRATKA